MENENLLQYVYDALAEVHGTLSDARERMDRMAWTTRDSADLADAIMGDIEELLNAMNGEPVDYEPETV